MNPATIVILLLLAALCVYSVTTYARKLNRGGGCCGEHEAAVKRVKAADRNPAHYPHAVTLKVDGMTCGNCARRVENALNALEGVWAREISFGEGTARVLTKAQPDAAALKKAVADAGYTVLRVEVQK